MNLISPFSFLICNIFIILLLGIFLLLRHVCKAYISVKSSHRSWYLFAFVLLLPFIPYRFAAPTKLWYALQQLISSNTTQSTASLPLPNDGDSLVSTLDLSDFSQAIGQSRADLCEQIFFAVWGMGCILACGYFLYHMYRIYHIRKDAFPVTPQTEPELYEIYQNCTRKLNIRRSVSLYSSCTITSPVSYGIFRPKILIPQDMDILFSEEEISFIFLHELQHHKRGDALFNEVSCLLKILYWFNPFVWYAFSLAEQDREIACDHGVLDVVGAEHLTSYGYTLIHYIEKMRTGTFLSPLSYLGGKKQVMTKRIREIAGYQADSKGKKLASLVFLLGTCLLIYCTIPFLNVTASWNSSYDFSGEQIETLNLSLYFQDTKGSFVLYDVASDQYLIYNEPLSRERVSPDSTFKIYSALFALEEGILAPHSTMSWDGTLYSFDSWNQNQTLQSALQNSVNWYFQNLDRELGYSRLYAYYNRISYGNCNLFGGIENYWAESTLKISPIEQVKLLSNFLENSWEFDPMNIEIVKKSLYVGDYANGNLYGKTGTGLVDGKNTNGWFVGYLERDGKTYCFATNLQDSDIANGNSAMQITVDILNSML